MSSMDTIKIPLCPRCLKPMRDCTYVMDWAHYACDICKESWAPGAGYLRDWVSNPDKEIGGVIKTGNTKVKYE